MGCRRTDLCYSQVRADIRTSVCGRGGTGRLASWCLPRAAGSSVTVRRSIAEEVRADRGYGRTVGPPHGDKTRRRSQLPVEDDVCRLLWWPGGSRPAGAAWREGFVRAVWYERQGPAGEGLQVG